MSSFLSRFTGGLAPTLLFGFAAHVAAAAIGTLAVPLYLKLMGSEAYGLAAFYFVLQLWMQLFDFGIAQVVSRQLSHYKAGTLGSADAVDLLAAAEAFFLVGGLLGIGVFYVSAGWIAHHWLGPSHLSAADVNLALRLTGCLLVLRWWANMYQLALIGLERQIAVNTIAVAGALVRNYGAILILFLAPHEPVIFFAVWALVTLLEVGANRFLLARAMPSAVGRWRNGWALLWKQSRFAAGLMLNSALWIMIGQIDKLTLSHTLPLGDFGVFSLVITICAGIALVVPPTVQSFQPRLTTLLAQGRRPEFVETYKLSIAVIIVVVAGLAAVVAAQPELVIYTWTGDRDIAARLATTLTLYAVGSGIASFLFLPFMLQFAQGSIRLHLIGNLSFGIVWIPASVWAASTFGTVGAGAVWLVGNALFLVIWVPLIHRRLLSADERRGLGYAAVGRVAFLTLLLVATHFINTDAFDRLTSFLILATISLTIMAVAALSSRELRAYVSAMIGYRGAFSR